MPELSVEDLMKRDISSQIERAYRFDKINNNAQDIKAKIITFLNRKELSEDEKKVVRDGLGNHIREVLAQHGLPVEGEVLQGSTDTKAVAHILSQKDFDLHVIVEGIKAGLKKTQHQGSKVMRFVQASSKQSRVLENA